MPGAKREVELDVDGIGRVVATIEQMTRADGSIDFQVLLGAIRVNPEPFSIVTSEDELARVAKAAGVSF
ncbi:hypothetical protein ACSBPH_05635 [Microbacterium sp. F51-2R]|jgi:hypothetical protein|uniref:hypothetical protein n=1 Tax=Microbacterium sp. F51-2R TaxID=3445777 RepID=UPI003F9F22C8